VGDALVLLRCINSRWTLKLNCSLESAVKNEKLIVISVYCVASAKPAPGSFEAIGTLGVRCARWADNHQ